LNLFEQLRDGLDCDAAPWVGGGLQAAVLVALTDEEDPQVILARRAKHLRLHPGEIAFPGGKREPEDVSPWDTAKREAWEEIGLEPALVSSLGEFSPLVTRSNFEVFPCIAKIPAVFDMVVDPGELESVFMTPLRVFADEKHYHLEKISTEAGSRMVPHYQINQDNVWGVTAAVLVQLVNLVLNANLDLGVTGR
jgi:8-oxo-dGTP pyrophosphatase MutT (NUDIX family)